MTPSAAPSMQALTPEMQAELEKLRDIRLPDPVSWWPLAPGWWGLIALCLLLVLVVSACLILRRRTVRYAALCELDRLRERADGQDLPSIATAIGVLLRRVAIQLNGRSAGLLAGADWAAFLGEGKGGIDPLIASYLAEAPYAPPLPPGDERVTAGDGRVTAGDEPVIAGTECLAAAERWIRKQS